MHLILFLFLFFDQHFCLERLSGNLLIPLPSKALHSKSHQQRECLKWTDVSSSCSRPTNGTCVPTLADDGTVISIDCACDINLAHIKYVYKGFDGKCVPYCPTLKSPTNCECRSDNHCEILNAICSDNDVPYLNKTCKCRHTDKPSSMFNKCLTSAKNLGVVCIENSQCKHMMAYCAGFDHLPTQHCNCELFYVPNTANDYCLTRKAFNQQCSDNTQCLHLPAECVGPVGNTGCNCNNVTMIPNWNFSKCLFIRNVLSQPCDENSQCVAIGSEDSTSAKSECIEVEGYKTCSCNNETTIVNQHETACFLKPQSLGDRCETDSQCIHMAAVCLPSPTIGNCSCADGSYSNGNNDACLQIIGIGGICVENSQCYNILAECIDTMDGLATCKCNNVTTVINTANTKCLVLAVQIGDVCEEDVQCLSLNLDDAKVTCKGIPNFKTCELDIQLPVSCTAIDDYGRTWYADVGQTVQHPCPRGAQGQCYWTCTNSGTFDGDTPYYRDCKSRWLGTIVEEFESVPILNATLAMEYAAQVQSNLSAILLSVDISDNEDIFGFEISTIIHIFQDLVTKIPNDGCDEQKVIEIAVPIFDSIIILLEYRRPWLQLQTEEKKRTFSELLDTVDFVGLTLSQRVGLTNKTEETCSFFSDLFYSHDNMKIEIISIKRRTVILFPQTSNKLRGKDSFISLPEGAGNPQCSYIGSHVSSTYLMDYANSFFTNPADRQNLYKINSDLIGLSFVVKSNDTVNDKFNKKNILLAEPVHITLFHVNYAWGVKKTRIRRKLHEGETPKFVAGSAKCVFWDSESLGWSSKGCKVVTSSSFSTVCSCNHLTKFTMIMQAHEYIGKTPLLITVIITSFVVFVFYLLLKALAAQNQKTAESGEVVTKTKVIRNFGLMLTAFSFLIIFFFSDRHFFLITDTECYIIGALSQFLILYVLLAMTNEFIMGHVEYLRLHEWIYKWSVNSKNQRKSAFYIGIPLLLSFLILVTVFMIDFFDGPDTRAYGGDFCWVDGSFVWSLFGPMIFLLLINTLILAKLFLHYSSEDKELSLTTWSGVKTTNAEIKHFAKTGILLNALVCLSWIVGFFQFGPYYIDSVWLAYAFPILQFLQGHLMTDVVFSEKQTNKLKSTVKRYGAIIWKRISCSTKVEDNPHKKDEDSHSNLEHSLPMNLTTEDSQSVITTDSGIPYSENQPVIDIKSPIKRLTVKTNEAGQLVLLQLSNDPDCLENQFLNLVNSDDQIPPETSC